MAKLLKGIKKIDTTLLQYVLNEKQHSLLAGRSIFINVAIFTSYHFCGIARILKVILLRFYKNTWLCLIKKLVSILMVLASVLIFLLYYKSFLKNYNGGLLFVCLFIIGSLTKILPWSVTVLNWYWMSNHLITISTVCR